MNNHRKSRGFTLIEMLMTVAIISILVAIAYPGYTSYVRKAHRGEAISALMEIANAQEKFYLDCGVNSYATSLAAARNCAGLALGYVSATAGGYYALAVTAADATTYSLTATAQGSQVDDTGCTVLTLTSTGLKTPASGCW